MSKPLVFKHFGARRPLISAELDAWMLRTRAWRPFWGISAQNPRFEASWSLHRPKLGCQNPSFQALLALLAPYFCRAGGLDAHNLSLEATFRPNVPKHCLMRLSMLLVWKPLVFCTSSHANLQPEHWLSRLAMFPRWQSCNRMKTPLPHRASSHANLQPEHWLSCQLKAGSGDALGYVPRWQSCKPNEDSLAAAEATKTGTASSHANLQPEHCLSRPLKAGNRDDLGCVPRWQSCNRMNCHS